MKNIDVTIQYDEEKLTTLKVYLKGKNIDVNQELIKTLDNLYQKNVPALVRDFFTKKADYVESLSTESTQND